MDSRPFRRILVGWDASPHARTALETAAALADHHGGHVVALAVVRGPTHTETTDEHVRADHAATRQLTEPFELCRVQLRHYGARTELVIDHDRHIAEALHDYATEHGFDLIVLGRHGEGDPLHPRLGHVAEATAKRGPTPVLLVSTP